MKPKKLKKVTKSIENNKKICKMLKCHFLIK